MTTATKFLRRRGRIALTRELADVQECLADMGEAVQEFDAELKQRWTELKAEEARLWNAIQALNTPDLHAQRN